MTCVHVDGSLCLGYKRTLLVLHQRNERDSSLVGTEPPVLRDGPAVVWTYDSSGGVHAVSSVQAVPQGEVITTAIWLHLTSDERPRSPPVFRGAQSPHRAANGPQELILLGTSTGHIQLHNPRGHLLHRQLLHEQPVLGVQATLTPAGPIGALPEQESLTVAVSHPHALCSISTEAISALLRHVTAHAVAGGGPASPPRAVCGYTKWLMPRGTRDRSDGACAPVSPQLWRDALCAFTRGGGADDAAAAFISVGQGPAVALFEALDADGAPAPDPHGIERVGEEGGALDVKSMAKGLAGAVLGAAASAATDLLGLHPPGCTARAADTVNAIVGARRSTR